MPSQEGSTEADTSRPPLSPQLSGQQAPSRVQLGAVPQRAGALHNRRQLRKEDGLVTTCPHSSRCREPGEQARLRPEWTLPFLLQVPGYRRWRWPPRCSWPPLASSGAAAPPASWPGGLVPVASALAAPSVSQVLARWPLVDCGRVGQPSRVREAMHREAAASEDGQWALGSDRPWVCPHPPEDCLTLGRSRNPLRLSLLLWKTG
uniref:Uncharacterized protein n=1 Tax=Myotis myotis TaxID=51298 RepID=A0A7J7ZWK5_MYOMY|nr:hypothetical protein mMyoMyo1_009610 [Myotis myotis]